MIIAVVGTCNISNGLLKVDGLDIVSSLNSTHATLTAATASGAQSILSSSTIKCLKTAGNLSMTSDATSITLNVGSTIPIITTGKWISSTGTRENGLAWTGIVATNTAGQEISYTSNSRDANFLGNIITDGVCYPNSLACINDATISGTLSVDGAVNFLVIYQLNVEQYNKVF